MNTSDIQQFRAAEERLWQHYGVMLNAVLQSFPASGHLPWLDDADTQVRLIQEFLQG